MPHCTVSAMAKSAKKKGARYHGGCSVVDGDNVEHSVNVDISFDEALKLNLALQSALLKLNAFDRRNRSLTVGLAVIAAKRPMVRIFTNGT